MAVGRSIFIGFFFSLGMRKEDLKHQKPKKKKSRTEKIEYVKGKDPITQLKKLGF